MLLFAKDIMWPSPPMVSPSASLKTVAEKMIEMDTGVLPVGRDGKVDGIITDRDIVLRAVSKGKDPGTEKVSDYMTSEIYSCQEEDTIRNAAEVMKMKNVSRLIVMNKQNKIAGILSFGHIFRKDASAEEATDIVTKVTNRNSKYKKTAA